MRRSLVTMALPLLLGVACADASTLHPGDASSPSPSFDRLDVYEPLFRMLGGQGGGGEGRLIIVRSVCAHEPGDDGPSTCDEPFTAAEQDELATRLSDLSSDIRFAESPDDTGMTPENPDGARAVWVGPLKEVDGGYWSVAGVVCGGLCGSGGTFVLERDGDGWTVTGNAPGTSQWIA